MKLINLFESAPQFNISAFPVASNAINTTKPGYAEKLLLKVEPLIIAALADGEVVNTAYDTIKYWINEFVDRAFRVYISGNYLYAGKYAEQSDAMNNLSIPASAREIPGFLKKLAAIHETSEMHTACMILGNELKPLSELDAWMKAHMIKASDKKRALKLEKETTEAEFNAKHASHSDTQKLIKILKDTAASVEEDIYKSEMKTLLRIVNAWKAKVEADPAKTDYRKMFAEGHTMFVLQRVLTVINLNRRYSEPPIYALDPSWEQIIEKQARGSAADVVNHFVYKNSGKLGYILYTKNNLSLVKLSNVNVSAGAVECNIHCEFSDGSKFTANSSVVYHYSKLGNFFYRYPTLFRDVVLKDGAKMQAPTEQKMQEIFVK